MAAAAKHYVNNKQFLEAISAWKEKVKEAESAGEEIPPVTDYIGECFLIGCTKKMFHFKNSSRC